MDEGLFVGDGLGGEMGGGSVVGGGEEVLGEGVVECGVSGVLGGVVEEVGDLEVDDDVVAEEEAVEVDEDEDEGEIEAFGEVGFYFELVLLGFLGWEEEDEGEEEDGEEGLLEDCFEEVESVGGEGVDEEAVHFEHGVRLQALQQALLHLGSGCRNFRNIL